MLKRLALALSLLIVSLSVSAGGSSPGLYYGQVPTAAQWNSYFAAKLDYTPGAVNTVPYWDGGGNLLSALISGDCTAVANVFTCTSTSLAGGALGAVPYQSATDTTAFLLGNTTTTPQFYTSTGTGAAAQAPTLTGSTGTGSVVLSTNAALTTPDLGTPSALVGTNITGTAASLSIGGNAATATSATSATTATNVAGGTQWGVLYQSASGVTASTAAGSVGQVLTSNGTSAPTFQGVTASVLNSGEVTVTAHATTGDIFGAAANSILWDDTAGPTTTTAFAAASKAGITRNLRLNNSSKFTASANLIIEGTASGNTVTLESGAEVTVRAITTTIHKLSYGFTTHSVVRVQYANGYGSTNTVIRRYSSVVTNTGNDITYSDSATNGGSFTINNDGVYSMNYCDQFSAPSALGVSLNSSQLTIPISSITAADRLVADATSGVSFPQCLPITLPLASGDVVRVHTAGTASGGNTWAESFTIARVR